MSNLVIVAALKDEIQGLKAQMGIERTYRQDRAHFFDGKIDGKPVIVGYTGIGADSMEAGLAMLAELVPIKAVVGTGYCGALADDMETGTLVVATDVCALLPNHPGTFWDADAKLQQLCRQHSHAENALKVGRVLSVTQALTDPAQKQAAGQNFEAVAVDMESAGLARFCAQQQTPFAVMRVVLDPVTDKVPDPSEFFDREKRISKRKVMRYVAKNPQAMWELPKLGSQAKQARKRIAEVMPGIVNAFSA